MLNGLCFNSVQHHKADIAALNDFDMHRTGAARGLLLCEELLCQELAEGGWLRTRGQLTWVSLSLPQPDKGGLAAQELRTATAGHVL